MPDILTPDQRRLNMSRVRSKDTRPEMIVRKGLHARGFRFRLHRRDLPGCPDLVLHRYRAVIFVNGCFWHGHDCAMFKLPSTNREFWADKINRNRANDCAARENLLRIGWRIMTIWECALRGRGRSQGQLALEDLAQWLKSDLSTGNLAGQSKIGK